MRRVQRATCRAARAGKVEREELRSPFRASRWAATVPTSPRATGPVSALGVPRRAIASRAPPHERKDHLSPGPGPRLQHSRRGVAEDHEVVGGHGHRRVVEGLRPGRHLHGDPRGSDHLLEFGQDRARSSTPKKEPGSLSTPSSAVGIVWMGWMEPKRTPALSFRTEAGWAPRGGSGSAGLQGPGLEQATPTDAITPVGDPEKDEGRGGRGVLGLREDPTLPDERARALARRRRLDQIAAMRSPLRREGRPRPTAEPAPTRAQVRAGGHPGHPTRRAGSAPGRRRRPPSELGAVPVLDHLQPRRGPEGLERVRHVERNEAVALPQISPLALGASARSLASSGTSWSFVRGVR